MSKYDSMASAHSVTPLERMSPHFLRRWTLATFFGEMLGFAVPGVVGALAAAAAPPDAALIVLMVCAGTIEGAALGYAQSYGFRDVLPHLPPADWIRATALAAAVAWAIGMTAGTEGQRLEDAPVWVIALVIGCAGAIIVCSIGTAQWSVLRHHVKHAGWWIPANVLAWALGVSFVFAATTPMTEDTPVVAMAAASVLSGAAMAATVALVTGWALLQLLRQDMR